MISGIHTTTTVTTTVDLPTPQVFLGTTTMTGGGIERMKTTGHLYIGERIGGGRMTFLLGTVLGLLRQKGKRESTEHCTRGKRDHEMIFIYVTFNYRDTLPHVLYVHKCST
jgi:hypothetical protein